MAQDEEASRERRRRSELRERMGAERRERMRLSKLCIHILLRGKQGKP
jgi:hypothetical protein